VESVNNCTRAFQLVPCQIDVCSKILYIPPMFTNETSIQHGIDVSNKTILFECLLASAADRCILDGSSSTRLFYGSNTNVTFNNFIFRNGFDAESGGAIKMQNNSIVTLLNCDFVNCSAPSGAAVSLNNTKFVMEGPTSSIVGNTGNGASAEFFSSSVSLYDVYIGSNNARFNGSEILMFNSSINVFNLTFENESNTENCRVYVAIFEDKLTRQSSCIGIGDDTILAPIPVLSPMPTVPSAPVLAPSAIPLPAPSPAPIPAPYTTPSPGCFSGENLVEVQYRGLIRMDDIKVGDYIMSGNGEFTQVYGFGHMDHDQDAVFLQIYISSDVDTNQTEKDNMVFPFIEVSPNHLVFMNRKNQSFPIRASDIMIGDTLNKMVAVQTIHKIVRHGLYAPLTYSGDLMVNGVIVSNYVAVIEYDLLWNQHIMGHFAFFPQRIFCRSFIEICKTEKYIHGYGYLAYIIILGSSAIQRGFWMRNILVLIVIGFLLCLFTLQRVCIMISKRKCK
jgi:Hint module